MYFEVTFQSGQVVQVAVSNSHTVRIIDQGDNVADAFALNDVTDVKLHLGPLPTVAPTVAEVPAPVVDSPVEAEPQPADVTVDPAPAPITSTDTAPTVADPAPAPDPAPTVPTATTAADTTTTQTATNDPTPPATT